MHSMDAMTRAGCTTRRGIRFWEDQGLLGDVERNNNDVRRYTPEQLDCARIIAAAQFGGWTLEEIKEMLVEYNGNLVAYDAITERLADQMRAAARLAENLPIPLVARPVAMEFDL